MHAAMMAADPPLIYLQSASWQVIECVSQLRQDGVPLFFTADAGPNIKVFCTPKAVFQVEQALLELNCIKRLILSSPGKAVELIDP